MQNLREKSLLINFREIESPMGANLVIDGKSVLNFCSNNYLGLANHPKIKLAAKNAIDKFGVGPGAVRTIAGTNSLHNDLEKALAKFKKAEDVIIFQSGFMANLATIPALVGEGDIIFSDELNHASIIDACRLSKAEVIRYHHLDTSDLEEKFIQTKKQSNEVTKKLIISDGVFSMDGDIAPLPELTKLAEEYSALLMVDDAHGEGVLGGKGRGITDHFNLHGKVDVEVGTMSKAFGVVGGMVAGRKLIIDWLRQKARPFLFSSAMTIPDTAACLEAVKILEASDELVKKLWENTYYFKNAMTRLGFDIGNSQTPIVPVMLGEAKLAKEFSKLLFDSGIFATAITYPTVPLEKARIRVMISASHTKDNLDKALKSFKRVGFLLNVIT
ncbi:glycine C-acetyltransferase [Candidatus Woesebacteria bacterium RIFCSPLOWO2_01_FULL_39_23]|uniref:8-amino-7-oxononanoate synthase n=1 Tax=Candidatus Woesebacteria bacterium RIFCSPHIGHO2_01_FULL_40_22 TaxID=1802499 RepID=A0A1F7YGP1_9BACT|nr:MAG: glycine C-acetyltransferase [Candidatus Woesebacteria bacterium RBG_16_40_11]OGM26521.1 MAG: glycine C-acetyltransferase [Candidatus Woesebacteria bacterium RIFCSPHIGHO2_01_FULL_40_22]OGM37686.1 MAG: glycine C-acetyltransferase [Candidatus Woesebacteria bacterium RIFCSPHIGHO2_12_FULL_38_9]OGM62973.1 MAG: glycine C-acetyltransferase [Candidatus Woesebacteria bacterium RIFCSPLOWO2_01_FULL_39_23]